MTNLLIKIFIKDKDVSNTKVRDKYGYFSSLIGIFLNILLFIGKLTAGIISGAVSIAADAFNNLSDAGSSVMTLVGFKLAGMPADKEHPFGHGRMEYVSGIIISFIIMLMGFELLKTSAEKIFRPKAAEAGILAFSVLIISVIVKMWMFLFYRKIADIINSSSIKAAAMDSWSDVIATSAVIVSMIVTRIWDINIDGYVGALVSLFILYTGISTFRESLTPILGTKPDENFVREVRESVLSYHEIIGIHDLLVHDYGVGNRIISLHAEVSNKSNFDAAHELIDRIELDLRRKYNCVVTIHMDPVSNDDEETIKAKTIVEEIVAEIDGRMSIHDFRITAGKENVNLIFDIIIPFDIKTPPERILDDIKKRVFEYDRRYSVVAHVDRDFT